MIKRKFNLIHYLYSICFLITLIIVGCEGSECSDGVVYDQDSKMPIDSVLCVSNSGDEVYTNSFGRYTEICSPFGGCMPKCSELRIEFSKIGYQTHIETERFDTVYLIKVDKVSNK